MAFCVKLKLGNRVYAFGSTVCARTRSVATLYSTAIFLPQHPACLTAFLPLCSSRACNPPHSCNLAADVLNAAAVLNIQPRDPTRFYRGLDPTIAAAKSACPCVAVFRTTHHTVSPPLPTPFFLLKPFLSFASPRFAAPSWCCHFMFFAGVKAFGPGTSFA
jgi:hypothetical protein